MKELVDHEALVRVAIQVLEERGVAGVRRLAVSVPDAATMLGLGRSTVFGLIAAGRLQALKVGARTVIRVSDIERFIKEAA